jgi:hypothetical protein
MLDRHTGARRSREDQNNDCRSRGLRDASPACGEPSRDRRSMAAILCLVDEDPVLEELRAAGFATATVALLDLMPLMQVAWTDGHVSGGEREVIARAAARRRLVFDSARGQLDAWLHERPRERVFHTSLRALRRMLQRLPPAARLQARRGLLDECAAVAGASRDALGGRHGIDGEEHRLIARLATELADGADQDR